MKNLLEEHVKLIAVVITLIALIVGGVIISHFFVNPRDSTNEGSATSTTSTDKKSSVTVGDIKKESEVKDEKKKDESTAQDTLDIGLGSSVSVSEEQEITAQTLADNPPIDETTSTIAPAQATGEIPLEKIEFVVAEISVNINEVGFLSITTTPYNAANSGYVFESSNKQIVTVDENGKITALKTGEVTITATAKEKKKLQAQAKIIVTTAYK